MRYITVNEASEKWNISARRVCILCKEGRIPGAVKMSRIWMIPEHVKKPEDARKTTEGKQSNLWYLFYMPDYFECHGISPTHEEKLICDIQNKYLAGNITEAYQDVCDAIIKCRNPKVLSVMWFLKYYYSTSVGDGEGCGDALARWLKCIEEDKDASFERTLADFYFGKIESFDGVLLYNEQYNEVMPVISLLILKKTINKFFSTGTIADVSGLEIICEELAHKNSALGSAYFHLILAVYYNAINHQLYFEYHFKKALSILLPRKWYTPIAEYSATLDLSYIKEIDTEAYETVSKLSEKIIRGYFNVGIFESWISAPKMNSYQSVRVAFMIVQGKTYNEIADKMNISVYKVKQFIADLCDAFGLNSKNEIRAFVLRNLAV